jgi:hypothetical protein
VRAMLRDMGEPITLFGEREVRLHTCRKQQHAARCRTSCTAASPAWPPAAVWRFLCCATQLERRTRLRRLLALREGDAAPSAHPGQLVVEQLGIEQVGCHACVVGLGGVDTEIPVLSQEGDTCVFLFVRARHVAGSLVRCMPCYPCIE